MGILSFSKKYLISEFFLGLSLLLTLSLIRNIYRVKAGDKSISLAQETLSKLQKENSQLKKDLVKIKSDEYMEKQSRNMLGLSKEGDITLVLPEEEILKKFSPRRKEDIVEKIPDPIWKRWVSIFLPYQ